LYLVLFALVYCSRLQFKVSHYTIYVFAPLVATFAETPFLCLLDIVPIKNEGSAVVMFLVSHKEVTKDGSITEEIEERSSSSTSNGINSYHGMK